MDAKHEKKARRDMKRRERARTGEQRTGSQPVRRCEGCSLDRRLCSCMLKGQANTRQRKTNAPMHRQTTGTTSALYATCCSVVRAQLKEGDVPPGADEVHASTARARGEQKSRETQTR